MWLTPKLRISVNSFSRSVLVLAQPAALLQVFHAIIALRRAGGGPAVSRAAQQLANRSQHNRAGGGIMCAAAAAGAAAGRPRRGRGWY